MQDGKVERRAISIVMNDNAGEEIQRWNLFECWPRRWQTGPLNAESSHRLVEQIVIVTELLALGD